MGRALKIRDDLSAEALRQAARREKNGRAAARMYAIANALEGLSRAEAARLAGMERQALRDAVLRYNAEGLAGLHDRPKGRPPRRLTPEEEAALVAAILRGPDPEAAARLPWAYIFTAIRPATGEDVTLVLPTVNTAAMRAFLDHLAASRPPDVHLVLGVDGAGWHISRDLTVPANITLVVLPPYSPELNPVERVWLYLRERFLSLRLLPSTDAIIDACCDAWMRLVAEPGRIRSLCAYPWTEKVAS